MKLTLTLTLDTWWGTGSPSFPMARALTVFVCASLLLPSLAGADEPVSEEQALAELRHSGTYQEGMEKVREKLERAYDIGAVVGAAQWEKIHDYYVEVARAKGCKKGVPFAEGPVKACHKVSTPEPKPLGSRYKKGRTDVIVLSSESLYPKLVSKVLLVIYDYGYVQGAKHVLRKHNDDLLWAQAFYRSCIERANDALHEPACADDSKRWSQGVLKRLRDEVEAHGLPTGREPN